MLVLTRKPEQSIDIGDGVLVRVLSIDRGRVKLGIVAPEDIKVLRSELREREPRRVPAGKR